MQRRYEMTLIFNPAIGDEVAKELLSKVEGIVKSSGGEISDTTDWGNRRLAYPIRKLKEGRYVFLKMLSEPGIIKEIERILRLNEGIIRYLTVRMGNEDRVVSTEKEAELEGAEGGTDESDAN